MTGLFFDQALLPQGWVRDVRIAVAAGRIAQVSCGVAAEPGDERHRIGLPGVCNLHSHGFQRGMAGLAELRGASTDSFWTWREVMYRFVGRMTADDIEAVTAQAYVEMLEAGLTRVGEFHYIHHDANGGPYDNVAELAERIAAAAQATGIGLTLLPVFYAHAGFGSRAPDPGQGRFINDIERYARLLEASRRAVAGQSGAVVGVAPHSLRAVTPTELAAVVALAGAGPVHIHIAEQTREVDDCLAWSGQRPLQWLFDNAPVDRRWCLVHATHATDAELAAIAASGAVAGLCPVTEANLGDGTFDAPAFVKHGGRFGVGSDSNVLIGLTDELRQLEYSQRLARQARNVMALADGSSGRALFDGALRGGAQALGVGGCGLTEGGFADIVSLDADDVGLAGRAGDAILDSWIFGSRRPLVDCVWAQGRKVVKDGQHHCRDTVALRFRRAIEGLLLA
ncbi:MULTISPECIES: formimidoylglutamate deiminase [Rhodopseudomonas]|uniref:N-formimino-L-glutamate deiminase n=1 Tax=Rhodopseudomonas palustris TaxID=1076 RepID=A0A0D7F3L6_RHOPL|nr:MULTISPECIES: formimidoylglutamate deiminase [Rhodopseudomonas]KIZ47664.1 N-formimino-L-glutamate deiminase [Rhodopseudomonas palustris]MDF3808867.1 formimidoylglutamate deiminase [Rhodopseudomonas sp. BAL398]WOK19835.1 formimidoylglutamate deiminase [Rhodopseudomonas sp. BAL398]